MNIDQEIVESLKQCAKQAELETFPWMTEPAYTQHTRPACDGTQVIDRNYVYESRIKPDEDHCKNLVRLIRPLLADYLHPKFALIGDGFHQIIGRRDAYYFHDLESFAHMLISAADKVGTDRVVQLLNDFTHDRPLVYRMCAFLNGVHVTNELNVNTNVTLCPVNYSSSELNKLHQGLADMFPLIARGTCAMISIKCQAKPVFYRPQISDDNRVSSQINPTITIPGEFLDKSLEEFCESLSLVCNHPIDVFVKWHDLGDAREFVEPAVRHEISTWQYRKPVEFVQEDWNEAVKILCERCAREQINDTLHLALRRWIRSKIAQSDEDKLIELRIAFEALYKVSNPTEKSFRLAFYCAWHLGENSKQRHVIFKTLKKFYATASNVVHAGKSKAIEEGLIPEVQDLCREGIFKRLRETEEPQWTELCVGKNL